MALHNTNLQNCLTRLSRSTEPDEAVQTLVSIGDHVGLPLPCCLHDVTAPMLPVLASDRSEARAPLSKQFGWDDDVADAWHETATDFLTGPVISQCTTSTRPFEWETCELDDSRFSETMRTQGVYGGVCVPVHLPGHQVGAVGWVTRNSNVSVQNVLNSHANLLQLSAIRFLETLLPAIRQDDAQPTTKPLTKREIECLTLAAQGKTHREIGVALDRSATTVRFHLDRAVEKLDAVNKVHAVAIASSLGLVQVPFVTAFRTLQ